MAKKKNQSRERQLRCEPDMLALRYHFCSGAYDLQTLYKEPLKNTKVQEYNDWGIWRLAKNLQEKTARYSMKEITDILIYNKFNKNDNKTK